MTEVNLNTGTKTPIAVGAAGPDMTYANGFFWSMAGPNQIQRINVTPGQLGSKTFTVSTPAVDGVPPVGIFGAAWTYGNGDVGFSNNSSGNIYELKIANASSPTPTFTTVISQKGPATANNDGTNAPGLDTDLALTKTASPTMVDPGGALTFSLKVTNNGPGNSSGFVLNDPLPAGVTGASSSTPGCSVTGQTLVCAGSPLGVGASATATVTMNAPDPFTTPITNTATVTANENDPNPANNTSSATVSPNLPTVTLVKSAIVTPASDKDAVQVGDTIQYSYEVTNTGNTPLTSLAVSDATAGDVTCPVPASPGLAPGASETCTATAPYIVKQSDVDAGAVTDSATATGTDATGLVSPVSDPSSVTIPTVGDAPGLSIVKVAEASSGDSAPVSLGETIAYSYVVTNTGNVDLNPLSVSDATAGSVSCPLLPDPGLAPGQSVTCTADSLYTVTQADVDNGGITDTATASGTDAQGGSATSPPAEVHIPSVSIPAVSVDKTASVTPSADQDGVKVGDTIQYSYRVTNTGTVHLTSLSVSDPSIGAVSCPVPAAPGLAPGAAETCTADNPVTVTQADVDAGGVTDTATATGTSATGNTSEPSSPSTITVPAVAAQPAVSIDKTATVDPSSDQTAVKVGDTIAYSYTVTNTGNVTLASVAVDDPSAGSVTCPTPTAPGLAPGDSETCSADHAVTVTQADVDAGSVSDTASATGTDTNGIQSAPSSGSASVPAATAAPAVSVDKSAAVAPPSDQTAVEVGDSIFYSYKVTNTGNVTLASVAVDDPSAGSVTCPTPTAPGLAPGDSETCTADHAVIVTQADVDAGSVSDSATATGTDTKGDESPSSAPSTVVVPATPRVPAISLVKIADAADGDTSPISEGEQIHYFYLVTNTGNVDLTSLSVSDDKVATVSCPTPAPPGLAPGDSETCTGTYTVTAEDAANNSVTNSASATGTDGAGGTSPPATASTTVPTPSPAPSVVVGKTAAVTPSSDQDGLQIGDQISYAYMVTNTGNVNLSSVSVDDPSGGSVTCPTLTAPGLTPGASVTCTADNTHTVTQADIDAGSVTDSATATGTAIVSGNPITSPPSAPSTVSIPTVANPDVSIDKTATVTPAADQDAVKVGDQIQYSYLVTNTGNITLHSVAVDDPSAGTVTCPAPASPGLAPGASETCTADGVVTVTQADVDAGSIADTATATGTDVQGNTSPEASGNATVPAEPADPALSIVKHAAVTPAADQDDIKVADTIDYSYTVTNTGNVTLATISVTDPTLGSVSCPSLTAPGLAPGNSVTCTADESRTVTQDDIDAGGATDTATATGTDTNGNSTPASSSTATATAKRNPAVSLVKTATVIPAADQHAAKPGDSIAYSFKVTNIGNVSLTSLAVSDATLGDILCPTPAPPGLAPGASVTCTSEIQHVVDATDQAHGKVTNTATATGTDGAGETSPKSAPSTATVEVKRLPPPPPPPAQPTARLVVRKQVDKTSAYPGEKLKYTLTVTNDGPDPAANVTLTDTPSMALKVISISVDSPQAICHKGRPITCTLGTMAVDQSIKIVVVAQANQGGIERNTATANSTTKLVDTDAATSTATTKVKPVLDLDLKQSRSHAKTGQSVIYTLTVTNPTTVPIHNAVVCNDLPSGLLYVRSKPKANIRTGQPCWKIGTLRPHGSKRFTVVSNVAPGTAGRRTNRATAKARGVHTVHAHVVVRITRALPVPCGAASSLTAAGSNRDARGSPVAGAAC